jgi:monofunctional biosynthetic peptidoglycan transglycosylase
MSSDPPLRARGTRRRGGGFRTVLLWLFMIALFGPPLLVLAYRFIPPPVTILQLQKSGEYGLEKSWRPIDQIDRDLVYAVVAAEDARFCEHRGFDVEAIRKAMEANEKGGKVRGGSTISQQTAKNVFLWPQRSWVRKGAEAYFTFLTEMLWGKRRIMEVYLNVIEMAPGVYGAEAAAQRWFNKSAADLTRQEAARLAAILPSPRRYKAAAPGPYVRRRAGRVQAAIRVVNEGGLASCVFDGRRRKPDVRPEQPDEPRGRTTPQIDIEVLEQALNPVHESEAPPSAPIPYEALPEQPAPEPGPATPAPTLEPQPDAPPPAPTPAPDGERVVEPPGTRPQEP